MTRLQDQLATSQITYEAFQRIRGQRRNVDSIVLIPDTRETNFDELVRELYPTHYDIRKRPR